MNISVVWVFADLFSYLISKFRSSDILSRKSYRIIDVFCKLGEIRFKTSWHPD